MKSTSVSTIARTIFPKLGLSQKATHPGVFAGAWGGSGPVLAKHSPIDGSLLGRVRQATPADYELAMAGARKAFLTWRELPAL